MKKLLMLSSVLFFLYSCKKNDTSTDPELYGVVRDFTGHLDGCQIMIILNSGRKLELYSIPAGVTLIDGKSVAIKYTLVTNAFSSCMAGDIVNITSLRYL